jgi:hypothetical protein
LKTDSLDFNNIVDIIYNLPLEAREELKNLLEHNISDSKRDEIVSSYKAAKKEEKAGALKFSTSIEDFKRIF